MLYLSPFSIPFIGNETTANLLASAMLQLCQHPEAMYRYPLASEFQKISHYFDKVIHLQYVLHKDCHPLLVHSQDSYPAFMLGKKDLNARIFNFFMQRCARFELLS